MLGFALINLVGRMVGGELVGTSVGCAVGSSCGEADGSFVGDLVGDVVGFFVGSLEGDSVGKFTGDLLGDFVGNFVGNLVGVFVGNFVGNSVGNFVGDQLGAALGVCSVTPPSQTQHTSLAVRPYVASAYSFPSKKQRLAQSSYIGLSSCREISTAYHAQLLPRLSVHCLGVSWHVPVIPPPHVQLK